MAFPVPRTSATNPFVGLGTTVTATEPTGSALNDIQFLWFGVGSAATNIVPPAGWLQIASVDGTNSKARLYVGLRSSSAKSLVFSWTNNAYGEVAMVGYSGADTVQLYHNLVATTAAQANPANPNPPAVQARLTDQLVLAFGLGWTGVTTTWTQPTGYTLRAVGPAGSDMVVADKQVTGPTLEDPVAYSGVAAGLNDIVGISVVLVAPQVAKPRPNRITAQNIAKPGSGPNPANYGARVLGFTQGLNQAAASANLSLSIDTPGSITVAGQSMTMALGVALSTQGSITVQGQSVGLSLGIPVSPGSITIAGQSASMGLGVALSTPGSITINGQSVTMVQGTNVVIDTPGSITVQGQSVAMNLGVALGAGSVTVAGQSVTMGLGVSPSPGSISVTGQSITASLGANVVGGSITIAGQTVALDLAGSLSLSIDVPGSITIAGQDVAMVNSSPANQPTLGNMGPESFGVPMSTHIGWRKKRDEEAPIVEQPTDAAPTLPEPPNKATDAAPTLFEDTQRLEQLVQDAALYGDLAAGTAEVRAELEAVAKRKAVLAEEDEAAEALLLMLMHDA